MDLLFASGLMVEAKTVDALNNAHQAQALQYLMLTGMQHGLLINLRREKVEKQFVSTTLDLAERRRVVVHSSDWQPVNESSCRLHQICLELLADWGAFLSVALYREAIVHFFGGPSVDRARWALERAKAEAVPNLNAQLAVQYDAAGQNTIAGLQLGMSIPYRNRNQGGIRQARSELVSAELAVDETGLALQRHFEMVFQRYANARNQVDEYSKKDGILDKTKETLQLTIRGFEAEEFNSLDMLTAQRIYTQANLAYLDALREFWIAATEIRGLLLKNSLQEGPSQ